MASQLILASKNGDIETVRNLLDHGADPNSTDTIINTNTHTMSLSMILKKTTPLIEASKNGHIDIVTLLLERHADPNQSANLSESPPIIASQNGHEDIVKLLLDNGADPNITDTDKIPLICIASSKGQLDVVKILLETKDVYVDSRTTHIISKTPLMYAIESSQKNVVEYLLEKGASLTYRTYYNDIPLTLAAKQNDVDIFNMIYKSSIPAGVDPKHENMFKHNVLTIATSYNNADIIEYLFLNSIFDIGDLNNTSEDIKNTKESILNIYLENNKHLTKDNIRAINKSYEFLDNIVHTILVSRNKNLPEDLVRYTTSFNKTKKGGNEKKGGKTKRSQKRGSKKRGTKHKK